jgi:hydroxymethylpyrimidine pyrophosphatase-like HAD family hydrolase
MDRKPIIAIDFDGTVVTHAYPKIGEPLPNAIIVLKRLSDAGAKLVLWTCREDEGTKDYLTQAVKFLESHKIKIRSVNENHPDDEFRPEGSLKRKVFANMYIDDRNFPPLELDSLWGKVENYCEAVKWL